MTPTTAEHPPASALAAFALGKLDAPAAETIHDHLAGCADCRTVVETTPNDSLLALLRNAAGNTPAPVSSALTGTRPVSNLSFDEAALPPELRDHPRYRILRKLGEGGMGAVYQAEHKMMERVVAIKVISSTFVDSPEAVERFQREVRAAAKLEHANIVRAYDADRAGSTMLLAMEFVKGRTLAEVVTSMGPLPVAYACQCIRQAALGLQHAADSGMVHRDIKPQNLMLTEKGVVKILDFGLAKLVSERATRAGLTGTGMVMGTPEYMAPEQARNTAAADIRADIYSLGCTLFYLLVGRPPFGGGTALEIVTRQVVDAPPRVTDMRPEVPAHLADLIARMLAKDPAARPQTPKEVAELLKPVRKPAARTVSRNLPATSLPALERPANQRTRWLLPATIAAALLAGALLAGLVMTLRTKDGIVTLEVDPPDAKVEVAEGAITVRPRGENEPYTIKLAEGGGKLRISKAGFSVETPEVTLRDKGTTIKIDLKKVPPVPGPPESSSDYAGLATGRWVPLLPSAEEFDRLRKENALLKGSLPRFENGVLECNDAGLTFPPLQAKNAIIRAQVKKDGKANGNVGLSLRRANNRNVAAWFNGGGVFGIGEWRTGGPWQDLATCKLADNYETFFEFAFAAVGDKLTAYANGRRILEVPYDGLANSAGAVGVVGHRTGGLFRDIEIQVLDSPAPTGTKPATIPNAEPKADLAKPPPAGGILVVEVNQPYATVFVDGDKSPVRWDNDGQKTEINVPAGTHKLQVTKDGFTEYGEEVEVQDGQRQIIRAGLALAVPPEKKADAPPPDVQPARTAAVKGPVVVSTWSFTPPNKKVGQLRLYSNHHINSPDGPATWSLNGNRLVLRWGPDRNAPGGRWIDTCTLSPDRRSFHGQNQKGFKCSGTKINDGDVR